MTPWHDVPGAVIDPPLPERDPERGPELPAARLKAHHERREMVTVNAATPPRI